VNRDGSNFGAVSGGRVEKGEDLRGGID
jgi:hypothetical protein